MGLLGWPVLLLERGGPILERQLRPNVEASGRERVLVAEVGDGHAVDPMAPEDGDLPGNVEFLRGFRTRTDPRGGPPSDMRWSGRGA